MEHGYDFDNPDIFDFLPFSTPKNIVDYSIYNTLYPEAPLLFEGSPVDSLWEDTHFPGLDEDYNPDMDNIYQTAEQNWPREFLGRCPLQFYKDWHHNVTINTIADDASSSSESSEPDIETYP